MDSLLQLNMYPDHNTEVEDGQHDEQTLSTIGWTVISRWDGQSTPTRNIYPTSISNVQDG